MKKMAEESIDISISGKISIGKSKISRHGAWRKIESIVKMQSGAAA